MTKQEKRLWYDCLRKYPVNFIRQKIIGKYLADFYCPKAHLVVELDGDQHYTADGRMHDAERDEYLAAFGIRVLHITNDEINTNFEGCCMTINKEVREAVGYDPYIKAFEARSPSGIEEDRK